jgi:hypothetical protein
VSCEYNSFKYEAYKRTTTRNHNFFHHDGTYRQGGTEIVLPDGTDGLLQTLYGSHDGLIMVSLEKRCIIVDYGIVPTHDYGIVLTQAAVINPHAAMPAGAGWQVGRVSSTWRFRKIYSTMKYGIILVLVHNDWMTLRAWNASTR